MNHDLLHIQGKPYVLVPLHEYRTLNGATHEDSALPDDLLDAIHARTAHPIRLLRRHRDLTQNELADAAGLSRPYLTEIETGKKQGSINALRALADALDVDAGLLV